MPNIKIVNHCSINNENLYLMLTADYVGTNTWPGDIGTPSPPILASPPSPAIPATPASANPPVLASVIPWYSMVSPPHDTFTFSFDSLVGARLYVGYLPFPQAPVPNSNQYYGWIEFSFNPSPAITNPITEPDSFVWLNLSNVDITGLPLSVSGIDNRGNPYSLGYNISHNDLVNLLQNLPSIQSPPGINCNTTSPASSEYVPVKICAPDIFPNCYPSYKDYIKHLRISNAPLVITSDTGQAYIGNFVSPPSNPNDPDIAISLIASPPSPPCNTIQILGQYLNSQIIYNCDGGKMLVNNEEINDNTTDTNTSSVFREIMVGFNEGYFTPLGPNNNWEFYAPFQNDEGNQYAKIIHENSNSYGFPYSDSNLKVQAYSSATGTITLTIMTDDEVFGYSSPPPYGPSPTAGYYQFSIGTGSNTQSPPNGFVSLGDLIIIGNESVGYFGYSINPNGTFSGYLPSSSKWMKMCFNGLNSGQYIWILTDSGGNVSGTDGLYQLPGPNPSGPQNFTYIQNGEYYTLQLGAGLIYDQNASPPPKPNK